MSEPMVTPTIHGAPSLDVDLPRPSKAMFSGLVMFGCLVMLGYLGYILWKSDRRLERGEADFQETLSRLRENANKAETVNGSPQFTADGCSPACAEGHTYQPGCRLHVSEQPSASDTM